MKTEWAKRENSDRKSPLPWVYFCTAEIVAVMEWMVLVTLAEQAGIEGWYHTWLEAGGKPGAVRLLSMDGNPPESWPFKTCLSRKEMLGLGTMGGRWSSSVLCGFSVSLGSCVGSEGGCRLVNRGGSQRKEGEGAVGFGLLLAER